MREQQKVQLQGLKDSVVSKEKRKRTPPPIQGGDWHNPSTSEKKCQEGQTFKVILSQVGISRPSWATWGPISKLNGEARRDGVHLYSPMLQKLEAGAQLGPSWFPLQEQPTLAPRKLHHHVSLCSPLKGAHQTQVSLSLLPFSHLALSVCLSVGLTPCPSHVPTPRMPFALWHSFSPSKPLWSSIQPVANSVQQCKVKLDWQSPSQCKQISHTWNPSSF